MLITHIYDKTNPQLFNTWFLYIYIYYIYIYIYIYIYPCYIYSNMKKVHIIYTKNYIKHIQESERQFWLSSIISNCMNILVYHLTTANYLNRWFCLFAYMFFVEYIYIWKIFLIKRHNLTGSQEYFTLYAILYRGHLFSWGGGGGGYFLCLKMAYLNSRLSKLSTNPGNFQQYY